MLQLDHNGCRVVIRPSPRETLVAEDHSQLLLE